MSSDYNDEREPDYAEIIRDREAERHERWLDRMDSIYGRAPKPSPVAPVTRVTSAPAMSITEILARLAVKV